jgi:hypothetical protein
MPLPADVYTAGEVARICRVAARTVGKWCDGGKLKHHRVPESDLDAYGDRRVERKHLIEFMTQYKFPMDGLGLADAVVVYSLDAELPDFTVVTAASSFECGMLCSDLRPVALLVGTRCGVAEALTVANHAAAHNVVTALVGAEGRRADPRVTRFPEKVTAARLAEWVRSHTRRAG